MTFARLLASLLLAAACAFATPSFAQSVKVGLILPMTGPFTSTGKPVEDKTVRRGTHLF